MRVTEINGVSFNEVLVGGIEFYDDERRIIFRK
jgi:hypothetical protein